VEAVGKLKEEGLSILLVEQNASLAIKARRLRARAEQRPGGLFRRSAGRFWADEEIKSGYSGSDPHPL